MKPYKAILPLQLKELKLSTFYKNWENYAILAGDLVYNNLLNKLIADRMEIDLLSRITKTSMINENDKIKIIYKNNGIN